MPQKKILKKNTRIGGREKPCYLCSRWPMKRRSLDGVSAKLFGGFRGPRGRGPRTAWSPKGWGTGPDGFGGRGQEAGAACAMLVRGRVWGRAAGPRGGEQSPGEREGGSGPPLPVSRTIGSRRGSKGDPRTHTKSSAFSNVGTFSCKPAPPPPLGQPNGTPTSHWG